MDGAVVHQPGVGQSVEAGECLGVVGDDGLACAVPAGHDEDGGTGRITGQSEEQPVHGGVRQHHAEVGAAGCDTGRHVGGGRGPVTPQQYDGLARPEEQLPFRLADLGEPLDRFQGVRPARRRVCRRGSCACAGS